MTANSKFERLIIPFLFLFGVLFPSSIASTVSGFYELLLNIPILFILSYMVIRQRKYNIIQLLFSFVIVSSLILFTITSSLSFGAISPGAFLPYLIFSLLILVDFSQFDFQTTWLRHALRFISLFLIVFGFGTLTRNDAMNNFLIAHYSTGYEKLVPTMLGDLKPVGPAGSHSVAGFFFFIFFLLNFYTYKSTQKLSYLIISSLLLMLLAFLRSNTAYLYVAISFLLITINLAKSPSKLFIFLSIFSIFVGYVYYMYKDLIDLLIEQNLFFVATREGSGFAGRYSKGNYLEVTINYIKDHPFSPIGMSYSKDLFLTDSGIIIYFLRGSVFLLLSMYLGFYGFLKNNLNMISRWIVPVFIIFFLFEIGYPNLINSRTLYLIPFLIVYLNSLFLPQDAQG